MILAKRKAYVSLHKHIPKVVQLLVVEKPISTLLLIKLKGKAIHPGS